MPLTQSRWFKNTRVYELAIYCIAISASVWFMMYNLYWRFEVVHSVDDGHGHAEELSIEDMIEQAAEDTTNSELQLGLARTLWQNQRFEESYDTYRLFERHNDHVDADLLAELGHIYMTIRPNVEAAKYFTRALDTDSVNFGALLGLGRLMYEIGEVDRAKPYFLQILEHHSEKDLSDIAKKWLEKIENVKNVKRELE